MSVESEALVRDLQAWRMSEKGKQLAEIGEALGVTANRAGQLVRRYERRYIKAEDLTPINVRTSFWMLYGVAI